MPGIVYRFPAKPQGAQPVDVDTEQCRQGFADRQCCFNTALDTSRRNCRCGIDTLPAFPSQPDLGPGVCVGLTHRQEFIYRIDLAALIAGDDAGWYAGCAHQNHVGARIVLAEAAPCVEEEIVNRLCAGERRVECVVKGFFPEKMQGGGRNLAHIAGIFPLPCFAKGEALRVAPGRQVECLAEGCRCLFQIGAGVDCRSEAKTCSLSHRFAAECFQS